MERLHIEEMRARSQSLRARPARTAEPSGDGLEPPLPVEDLEREIEGLREAMASRAVIEQAKGIIMANVGCDPDEAFTLLVEQSQHTNRKLRDIAAELVEHASLPKA